MALRVTSMLKTTTSEERPLLIFSLEAIYMEIRPFKTFKQKIVNGVLTYNLSRAFPLKSITTLFIELNMS